VDLKKNIAPPKLTLRKAILVLLGSDHSGLSIPKNPPEAKPRRTIFEPQNSDRNLLAPTCLKCRGGGGGGIYDVVYVGRGLSS